MSRIKKRVAEGDQGLGAPPCGWEWGGFKSEELTWTWPIWIVTQMKLGAWWGVGEMAPSCRGLQWDLSLAFVGVGPWPSKTPPRDNMGLRPILVTL